MKIVVTGGSGLIGRAVIAGAIAEGHQVLNVDLAPPSGSPSLAPFLAADVRDHGALVAAFSGCDALVHMAAYPNPIGRPGYVVHNGNVRGSYNALSAAIEVGIRTICLASSVNAIGLSFSRAPRFDYFPLDEQHPCYAEDPYSVSKWICEQQADAFARRYEDVRIASLRFHLVVTERGDAIRHYGLDDAHVAKHLWAYSRYDAAVQACLLSLTAPFVGHETFNIVAPDTLRDTPTLDLARRWYAHVPIRREMSGNCSFFDSTKAERLLGWRHATG